jgi:hypothetical protein
MKILKNEKIRNPIDNHNHWKLAQTKKCISISTDGLNVTSNANGWQSVSAEKGFNISVDFPGPGPVLYYFEITNISSPYTK